MSRGALPIELGALKALCRAVARGDGALLRPGEAALVGLVLDRPEVARRDGATLLEAAAQLDAVQLAALLTVQREGIDHAAST